MKTEKLQDANGLVGDDLIIEAQSVPVKAKRKKLWFTVTAACLTVAIILGVIFLPKQSENKVIITPQNLSVYAIKQAEYPQSVEYPSEESENFFEEEKQWKLYRKQLESGYNSEMNTDAFFKSSFKQLLKDTKGKNKVYSPLNIYFTLGMLAELTYGNTREEILDILGISDIEKLRENANAIWKANYYDDRRVTSLLSSSLWLNDTVNFKSETLNRVAETYFASSYKGTMGTKEFDGALISWINSNTKNLLSNKSQNIEMPDSTVLAIASTIYFKAAWLDEFHKSATVKEAFYADNGEIECDFMNASRKSTVYYGKDFTATKLGLNGSGNMYFILPDKGVSVDKIVNGSDAADLILSGNSWKNQKKCTVNFSIPKFDVTGELDLTQELKKLGLKDAFNRYKADFSPTTDDTRLFVSKAEHIARVTIDEKGCTGAAYTLVAVDGMSAPPNEIVDFKLNRPFLFAVTSVTGDVLFAGVVSNP